MDRLRNVFGKLNLIVEGIPCIRIVDPEVKRICLTSWDFDKDGDISVKEAESATTLFKIFSGNSKIETFEEFKNFKNISTTYDGNFNGCSSLRRISLPESYIGIRHNDFYGTALEHIDLPSTLISISAAFTDVFTLKEITIPESVTNITGGAFDGTGLSRFVFPKGIKEINGISRMQNLTYVEIGENAISVTNLSDCPKLVVVIIRAAYPPSTTYWTLRNTPTPNIYVPDASVVAYKESSGWKAWAANIKPLSSYNGNL